MTEQEIATLAKRYNFSYDYDHGPGEFAYNFSLATDKKADLQLLHAIKGSEQLSGLWVADAPVTAADIEAISSFKKLRGLTLSSQRHPRKSVITDSMLMKLTNMPELYDLQIEDQPITTQGLIPLITSSPGIINLYLSGTDIDDSIIPYLGEKYLPKLNVVQADCTNLSEAGVEKIKKRSDYYIQDITYMPKTSEICRNSGMGP